MRVWVMPGQMCWKKPLSPNPQLFSGLAASPSLMGELKAPGMMWGVGEMVRGGVEKDGEVVGRVVWLLGGFGDLGQGHEAGGTATQGPTPGTPTQVSQIWISPTPPMPGRESDVMEDRVMTVMGGLCVGS